MQQIFDTLQGYTLKRVWEEKITDYMTMGNIWKTQRVSEVVDIDFNALKVTDQLVPALQYIDNIDLYKTYIKENIIKETNISPFDKYERFTADLGYAVDSKIHSYTMEALSFTPNQVAALDGMKALSQIPESLLMERIFRPVAMSLDALVIKALLDKYQLQKPVLNKNGVMISEIDIAFQVAHQNKNLTMQKIGQLNYYLDNYWGGQFSAKDIIFYMSYSDAKGLYNDILVNGWRANAPYAVTKEDVRTNMVMGANHSQLKSVIMEYTGFKEVVIIEDPKFNLLGLRTDNGGTIIDKSIAIIDDKSGLSSLLTIRPTTWRGIANDPTLAAFGGSESKLFFDTFLLKNKNVGTGNDNIRGHFMDAVPQWRFFAVRQDNRKILTMDSVKYELPGNYITPDDDKLVDLGAKKVQRPVNP